MDKEPSLLFVVLWGALGSSCGFFACRKVPGLLLLAIPAAGSLPFCALSELRDPFVGPAILREAGSGHLLASIGALAVAVFGPLLGTWQKLRGHSRRRCDATSRTGPVRK